MLIVWFPRFVALIFVIAFAQTFPVAFLILLLTIVAMTAAGAYFGTWPFDNRNQ